MEDHGPYTSCFSLPREGIIKQELITYEIKDGVLRKVTIVREFSKNDYDDHQIVEPLYIIKDKQ